MAEQGNDKDNESVATTDGNEEGNVQGDTTWLAAFRQGDYLLIFPRTGWLFGRSRITDIEPMEEYHEHMWDLQRDVLGRLGRDRNGNHADPHFAVVGGSFGCLFGPIDAFPMSSVTNVYRYVKGIMQDNTKQFFYVGVHKELPAALYDDVRDPPNFQVEGLSQRVRWFLFNAPGCPDDEPMLTKEEVPLVVWEHMLRQIQADESRVKWNTHGTVSYINLLD